MAAPDAIVAGGGIVGAACAYALSRSGLHVEVVESGPVGGGATGAGMGHLVALDALSTYSVRLWHELSGSLPHIAEFTPCGTVWVAEKDEDFTSAPQGVPLNAKELYEEEPALRKGLAGGVLNRSDAVVYAPAAARWLIEQPRIRLLRGEVARFTADGVHLSDGTHVSAGIAVCALGMASARLLPELPLRARKGHLAITDRYPGLLRHQVVELAYRQSAEGDAEESVAFNVQPRPTGQLLIGSSRQYGVESARVESRMLTAMLARVFEYMPALRECSILRTWTGFRAATPDKQPLIGHYRDRLYVATGHEGLGVTTSMGTARMLAAMVEGKEPPLSAAPYDPWRFHGL